MFRNYTTTITLLLFLLSCSAQSPQVDVSPTLSEEKPTEEEKELVVMVTNTMEKAMPLSVPVIVDYGIGDNWYEAH